jgi:predicted nucleotidyltransferase
MISGAIISEMTTEILGTLSTIDDVVSVWGFGSFFRGEQRAKDIDLLAVVSQSDLELDLIRLIRNRFDEIATKFHLEVDLTILTTLEFAEGPLQEMEALVPLFERQR